MQNFSGIRLALGAQPPKSLAPEEWLEGEGRKVRVSRVVFPQGYVLTNAVDQGEGQAADALEDEFCGEC